MWLIRVAAETPWAKPHNPAEDAEVALRAFPDVLVRLADVFPPAADDAA